LSALSYAHKKGIYHFDLKPENVLLDNANNLKLILLDIGLNQHLDKKHLYKLKKISPYFIPPELLYQQMEMGASTDIWNCGVLMHILLTGYPPFTGKYDDEII